MELGFIHAIFGIDSPESRQYLIDEAQRKQIQDFDLSRDAAQRVMDDPPSDGAGAVHHAADQGAEE